MLIIITKIWHSEPVAHWFIRVKTKEYWLILLVSRTILFYQIIFSLQFIAIFYCKDVLLLIKIGIYYHLTGLHSSSFENDDIIIVSIMLATLNKIKIVSLLQQWDKFLVAYNSAHFIDQITASNELVKLIAYTLPFLSGFKLFIFVFWLVNVKIALLVGWLLPWFRRRLVFLFFYIWYWVLLQLSSMGLMLTPATHSQCVWLFTSLVMAPNSSCLAYLILF